MSINIENLINTPDAKVVIHKYRVKDVSEAIVGFINTDFSFNSSAEWQSPFDVIGGALRGIQNLLNVGAAVTNAIADTFGLEGIASKALRSYAMTAVDYMGTNKPTFTLPLIFPAIKPADDPRIKILDLLECVYPSGDGLVMDAPLGYARGGKGFDLARATKGYVDVQIGQWARFNQLVVSNVDSSFSKEVIYNTGIPVYAKATVSFTFIRVPSFNEIRSFLSVRRS